MLDIVEIQRRRAPRYQMRKTDGLTVTIQKTDDSSECVEVQLLDLSVGGARIRADRSFTAKQVLAVTIVAESPKRIVSVSGEVCWVAPATGEDWSLGCKFVPPIPDDVLHEFAEAGVIERRQNRRQRTSKPAIAMWESRVETSSVHVIDYSHGGYCLSSLVEPSLGESMLLRLESDEGEVTVKGKIKWHVETQEGFVVGCEYADPQDYHLLHGKSPEEPRMFAEQRYDFRYRMRRAVLAFVAVLFLATLAGHMLLNNEVQTDGSMDATVAAVTPTTSTATRNTRLTVDVHRPTSIEFERATADQVVVVMDVVAQDRPILVKSVPAVSLNVETTVRSPSYRTWIDSTGHYKAVARLVSVENQVATLQKRSGRFASVPVSRLSDNDRAAIREWLKDRNSAD